MGLRRKEPEETKGRRSEHLWNGCGSETGKSERKQTVGLSKQNRKKRTGNQPGRKRKNQSNERSEGATEKPLGGETVKKAERKNRGLVVGTQN